MIEIEKRVQIKESDIESTLSTLREKHGQPVQKRFITILLKGEMSHGRIRRTFGSETCIFTTKTGTAGDTVREEDNTEYKLNDLDSLRSKVTSFNFTRALTFETNRYTFKQGKLSIELSDHGIFGKFLEVEQVQDDNLAKTKVIKKIDEIFKELKMEPMSALTYQKHMDEIFMKYSHPLNALDLTKALN